jgi:hypothetical protein
MSWCLVVGSNWQNEDLSMVARMANVEEVRLQRIWDAPTMEFGESAKCMCWQFFLWKISLPPTSARNFGRPLHNRANDPSSPSLALAFLFLPLPFGDAWVGSPGERPTTISTRISFIIGLVDMSRSTDFPENILKNTLYLLGTWFIQF